ncbi:PREDICTED: interferon-induced protein 44-like [Cyprinodon variegatus]|uniref:interferon-induced protein 44-like n=1 Tax=Cyprinodon variegatus TaxID=28743 RepID=UPI0007426641|nr:PREDICTED: interferon-induced protein 44-like [Cyprinodon variegatus]
MGKSHSKNPVLTEPWRTINWDNNQDNLWFLNNYKPQLEGQTLRILLYGPAGAGKSSFINSVQSVLLGRPYSQALADNTGHDSFTTEYTTHKIQKVDGSLCSFVFNDIMGLSTHKGVLEEDVALALKGHIKEGYTFDQDTPLSEDSEFYNTSPSPNDKVQVLVCVIPADNISIMDDELLQKIRRIRLVATKLNIAQVTILTKIDALFPEIQRDVRNVYRFLEIKEKMLKVNAYVGIPMNCMFPVRNYHEEINMQMDFDTLILSAMKHIIQYGDDFLKFSQRRLKS